MQTYTVTHTRPVRNSPKLQPIGSYTVAAVTWQEAVIEAHRGIPAEDGDVLVWRS